MKKILLLSIVLPLSLLATNYTKNVSGFYEYTGEPITQDIVWDFSQLQSSDIDRPNNIFAENLIEFQKLGLFKYGYYSSRQCGDGDTYAPLMWNGGNSMVNGVSTLNTAITNTFDFPAIYLPKSKYGIRSITIEGWGHDNPANLILMKKDAEGNWVEVKTVTLAKNAYTQETIVINDPTVKEIMFHRNSANNAYQFITKLTCNVMPTPEYVYNETTQRYDYIGEPLEETLVVDFSKMPSYLTAYSTTLESNTHADMILDFGHVGLYKWCYYASRSCGEQSYGPLIWNSGKSSYIEENVEVKKTNAEISTIKRPAIYIPTMKNGIKQVIVEGFGASNGNFSVQAKDVLSGKWKDIKNLETTATESFSLSKEYKTITLEVNNRHIKDVCFSHNSTSYLFFTKITVIPMEPVESEYIFNTATGRYDYVGEPIEGEEVFVVDFSELTPYDVKYNPNLEANTFADELVEFQHLGLYKYGYYNKRTCQNVEYTPLLWNSGKSEYQGELKNNRDLYAADLFHKLPCIYSPTFKNGIKQVIIEGWSNNNSRGINLIAQKTDGTWDGVKKVCPHTDKGDGSMEGNTYTTLTFNINSNSVKNIGTWINCTDWQFITKITIIPMGNNEVVIDENEDNEAVLTAYKDQTVNLTVYRSLKADMYNTFCLPGEVTLANFRTAIDDLDCESRWFNEANISNGSLNLIFSPNPSKIQAGFPYLIKPTKDITEPIRLENVEIKYTTGRNITKPNDNALVKFFSTLSPKDLSADENCLVLSGDNTLYFVDEAVTMKGLRGYFMLYNDAARTVKANKMPMRAIFPSEAPTEINPVKSETPSIKYIKDGQFIIVREGKCYNILGY